MRLPTIQQAAKDLLDGRGYGIVPCHISRNWAQKEVLEPFARLVKSPSQELERWAVDLSGKGDPDHGVILRDGSSGNEGERKAFGHFPLGNRALRTMFAKLARQGVDLRPHELWFKAVKALALDGIGIVSQVAQAMDELAPNFLPDGQTFFSAMIDDQMAWEKHMMRALYYSPKPAGEDLAVPHYDRGALTLAGFADTAGGLWVNTPDNLISLPEGQAVALCGRKMDHLTNGRIMATSHGVSSPSAGVERMTAVLFVHTKGKMGLSYREVMAASTTA